VTDTGGFFRFVFTEVARTGEYVEIERPQGAGKLVIRLYGGRSTIGADPDQLAPWHDGDWER
jgi:hypothetical protein